MIHVPLMYFFVNLCFKKKCVCFLEPNSSCMIANFFFYVIELHYLSHWGLPGGSDSKESGYHVGDLGSIPGLGRSPGVGIPLQYSCLENSMDRGA